MTSSAPREPRTLIDQLLAEQRELTAVERFARKHESDELPAQARYYRDLIPLGKPRPGEQYAFAVDLDACTGCKACVTACHSLNGLDDEETWRSVGLLIGKSPCETASQRAGETAATDLSTAHAIADSPFQQTVTTACHHCADPACLNGCPVLAYEKDSTTGIVRHLDDQCIGCQYCVLKCPYDVPKYSAKRGIVRKCDMCHGRLAANEAPACVQACPNGAITIRLVPIAGRGRPASGNPIVPGAFDSTYTQPTTRYSSRQPLPANSRAADAHVLRREPAHWPLIWMLVLTQVSAGVFVTAWITSMLRPDVFGAASPGMSLTGFGLLLGGLGVSVFHLGRPLGAWRAFLGLRRSWMSREIVLFGIFAGSAAVLVAAIQRQSPCAPALAAATAALGLGAVFCSAMIYVDTRRPFWKASLTFPKFFGTALLLGSAAAACLIGVASLSRPAFIPAVHAAAWAATIIRSALFVWESWNLQAGIANPAGMNHRSALTMWRLMKPLVITRAVLFVVSTVFGLLAIFGAGPSAVSCAAISFLSTFSSQVIERYFYFTAVVAPRMPGPSAS